MATLLIVVVIQAAVIVVLLIHHTRHGRAEQALRAGQGSPEAPSAS
jgi:hypothetical protein